MKLNIYVIFLFPVLLLGVGNLLSTTLFAQNNDICQDKDCPGTLLSIKLPPPSEGQQSPQRTEQYKNAYQKAMQMKAQSEQEPGWKGKYAANQLGGSSCLRMYDLEGYFAEEYNQNPGFKAFINQQEPDIKAFKERGFESSRRALNLRRRMQSQCPEELKEGKEKEEGTKSAFQQLGQELGYFDEQGNVLKPFNPPVASPPAEDIRTQSKRKQIQHLKEEVSRLPVGTETKNKLSKLKEGLNKAQPKLGLLKGALGLLGSRLGTFLPGPLGMPVVERTLDKLNELSYKAGLIGDIAEMLTGKKNRLQKRVDEIDTKISDARTFYDTRINDLDQLQNELLELVAEKSGLNDKLGQATDGLASLEQEVNEFIKRYTLFDEETDCISLEELRDMISEIRREQTKTESELEELEGELEDAEAKEEQLEEETQEVEQEIKEQSEQAAELEEEKEALKEEYGKDIELEPVTVEEWSESFEVERPYWDAVFHPDDEVVEGYKGRYFEVRLKDADKAVKLLFGPGEYFMSKSDFREQYGPTIGAFVTEALLALKKGEREKIRVFIQGSADISGQNTFSGQLDDNYRYDVITVLPQQEDGERFLGTPETRQTPARNFRNVHLPNLRGQYLREMITIYSKKLEPILLEGSVKEVVDKSDRNAVIYLFIPEELLD